MSGSSQPPEHASSDERVAHLRALGYGDPWEEHDARRETRQAMQTQLAAAVELARKHDLAGALRIGEELVGLHPEEPAPRMVVARWHFVAGNYRAAAKQLSALAHMGVESPELGLSKARIALAQRDYQEAVEWANYVSYTPPLRTQALLVQGEAQRRRGRCEQATQYLQEAADDGQCAAAALLALGAVAMARRDWEVALEFLLLAAEQEPQRGEIHLRMARTLMRLEQWEEARVALEAARRLLPASRGLERWKAEIDARLRV